MLELRHRVFIDAPMKSGAEHAVSSPSSSHSTLYNRVAGKIRRKDDSVNGRIFTAAIIIGALASLVKIVNLAKEILIARIFGAGDALDAFYVAILLPGFLTSIMVNSFSPAFIPTHIQVRETEGDLAAQRLFFSVAAFNLAALLGVSLALTVTAEWLSPIIGSGFGPEKLALTRTLPFASIGRCRWPASARRGGPY